MGVKFTKLHAGAYLAEVGTVYVARIKRLESGEWWVRYAASTTAHDDTFDTLYEAKEEVNEFVESAVITALEGLK
jgi:hypothetical protein